MGYGQSAACRWRLLLDYFGEAVEWPRCETCDNCRHPLEDAYAVQKVHDSECNVELRRPPTT